MQPRIGSNRHAPDMNSLVLFGQESSRLDAPLEILQEDVMDDTHGCGMSLEQISATPEWKSLGPAVRQILTLGLPARNLVYAVAAVHPGIDPSTQKLIAERLLQEETVVRQVCQLYAFGVIVPPTPAAAPTVRTSAAPTETAGSDLEKGN